MLTIVLLRENISDNIWWQVSANTKHFNSDWIFPMWIETEPPTSSSSENDDCLIIINKTQASLKKAVFFLLLVRLWHIQIVGQKLKIKKSSH